MISCTDRPRRVAAYCRVSTDKDDQVHSLESQKRYFREYIGRNPLWELAGIYVDEGITGTSTKKRRAFNQMMADAQRRAFDLIVTKEISRFARNTLDSILYTRRLKELGIGVVFLSDGINTLDADAELRLTIMSSIAQEESRKTSERVKWGQKRRMEQGVVFGRDLLGYDVRGGRLHINGEGAEVVRLIFHKFVNEGKGTHVIARELREAGIRTATYMKQWSDTAILRILRNEKYCGDLVQKKTYTPNYLNHEKKYNRGEEELVTLRGHHEPIVSRELFLKAQAELARRSPGGEQRARHSNRYCFSGKIKCGVCGRSFVSRERKRRDGGVYKTWRCYGAVKNGAGGPDGCPCMSVGDEDAKRMLRETVESLGLDRRKLLGDLNGIIRREVGAGAAQEGDPRAKLAQIAGKRRRLLELYLGEEISKTDFQQMNGRYEAEAAALSEEAERPKSGDALLSEIASVLEDILENGVWDDVFYRRILDKMVVCGDGGLDIRLRFFPTTWRFAAVDGGSRHFDASLPMSFRVALASGVIMEKR